MVALILRVSCRIIVLRIRLKLRLSLLLLLLLLWCLVTVSMKNATTLCDDYLIMLHSFSRESLKDSLVLKQAEEGVVIAECLKIIIVSIVVVIVIAFVQVLSCLESTLNLSFVFFNYCLLQ